MFTGIVEATGQVKKVGVSGTNRTFWIESEISDELKVDQSVSHNGVCLTVEAIQSGTHRVTAIEETLSRTNLSVLTAGSEINLERCMALNGRIDGHLVQGHVDATAVTQAITSKDGSWEYTFSFPPEYAQLVIDKGSVCINGVSLTLFNVGLDTFQVAIIPYTYEHTNIRHLKKQDLVNIEFDMIGKYITRSLSLRGEPKTWSR